MTPEPLNTILIVLVMTVAVLFVAAGVALLAVAVAFLVMTRRYRRFQRRAGLSAEQEADTESWLRRGRWGLAGCAALVVFYLLRGWVGDLYYEEISQGLVPFSSAWWVVWTATVPYYLSVLAGLAGTVAMLLANRRLGRIMRPSTD
jgi:uncharacterized membrane protein